MDIELIKIAQEKARTAYEVEMNLTALSRRELSRLRDDLEYQRGLVRAETAAIRRAIKQAQAEPAQPEPAQAEPAQTEPARAQEVCA